MPESSGLIVTKIGRKSMLGVEEPRDFRRASLISEMYSEAGDPLTAELTARGRRKRGSSTGIVDFGKLVDVQKCIIE